MAWHLWRTAKRWFWNAYTMIAFLVVAVAILAAASGAALLVGYLLSLSAGSDAPSCYYPGAANGC